MRNLQLQPSVQQCSTNIYTTIVVQSKIQSTFKILLASLLNVTRSRPPSDRECRRSEKTGETRQVHLRNISVCTF